MKRIIGRIDYSKKFDKHLRSAPLNIKLAFRNRLILFLEDQFHPQLNNHGLVGRLSGYRSINISGDWRAIYSSSKNDNGNIIITFEMLGTHSQLYK